MESDDGPVGPTAVEVLPPDVEIVRRDGPAAADPARVQAAPTLSVPVRAEPAPPALDPAVAALCAPLSEADPCGPDLDLEGDADYLNFSANVDGLLPTSFFSVEDGKPLDPSTIDIDGQLAALKDLLARTRDIRLLALQARLLILNRNLAGFAANIAAIAEWLDRSWDGVHPRPQDGDLDGRSMVISALDAPTVVFPLQYVPLFEGRRTGVVTYRGWMIATGEVKARAGDIEVAAAAITEAMGSADPVVMAAVHRQMVLLKTGLQRIGTAFAVRRKSAGLKNLPALVDRMLAFIEPYVPATTAGAASGEVAASDEALQQKNGSTAKAGPLPASIADAAQALATIADYYSHKEPSSPALPLVRQAHQLIGKSFLEVMTILVPSHVDKAAFHIGTEQVFELPLGKLSGLSGVAPALGGRPDANAGGDAADPAAATPARPKYRVESRAEAMALLDLVQRYFRHSEPSSPVPMLCERARALAERDFMGVLRDVLPKSALKNITADK